MQPRWDLVEAERTALADLLEGLAEPDWAVPSLCAGWTVKEVVAHLLAGPTTSVPSLLGHLVRQRGRIGRVMDAMAREGAASSTPAELVALLRRHAASRFHPPTTEWRAPLTDLLVHREDVAVPLGLAQDRPVGSWALALDYLVAGRGRSAFLPAAVPAVRMVATDAGWEHGEGPEVRGPATALGLALTGRPALLDRLSGPGTEVLTAHATASV
jgi:uncharacterized protein (TIGR03083 family)